MTEGTSVLDQTERLKSEFKKGEGIARLFSNLRTSPGSPWQRLEVANRRKDWLEEWRGFFPQNPLSHEIIEKECQRALAEICSPIPRLPASSSSRLTIEGSAGTSAPASAERWSDVPDPVLGPILEGSEDEPSSHPVPAREGSGDRLPPLPVPALEEHDDGLPPLLILVPEGPEDELPSLLVSVPEELENELPPLPVPVLEELEDELPPLPVPVHEGCEDALPPPAVPQRPRRRSPGPRCRSTGLSLRSPQPRKGTSGFSTALQGSTVVPGLQSSSMVLGLPSSTAGFLVVVL
ncbi:hypothetical protein CRENBAI_019077 [Crenichthys baileyi]|uniref:Uncharacterized protein n=1 Tax=Crenichthys baileyi TaxID=28760 RepID=A0AAV9RD48_9TELE